MAERLRAVIEPSWSEHVGFQESVIFPILRRSHAGLPLVTFQIDELHNEHVSVTGATHELSEQLDLVTRGTAPDVNMLGYMLRCTFKDWRGHLDWERRFFAAAIPRTLAPVDLDIFDRWLTTHPWPIHFAHETNKK